MTRYSSEARREHLPDQNRIREMEYFQSIYPQSIKMLQRYVTEECDRMDYKGSPMYDEYPDRIMIEQTCEKICRRISEASPDKETGERLGALIRENREHSEQEQRIGEVSGENAEWDLDVEQVEIYEAGGRAQNNLAQEENADEVKQQQLEERSLTLERPPQGPPPWGPPGRPPQGPPPWGPPGRPPQNRPPWRPGRPSQGSSNHPTWMQDIIRILLTNEMQNRRCRAGLC